MSIEQQSSPQHSLKKERLSWQLTPDQHTAIQHQLPKGFALIKPNKAVASLLDSNQSPPREPQSETRTAQNDPPLEKSDNIQTARGENPLQEDQRGELSIKEEKATNKSAGQQLCEKQTKENCEGKEPCSEENKPAEENQKTKEENQSVENGRGGEPQQPNAFHDPAEVAVDRVEEVLEQQSGAVDESSEMEKEQKRKVSKKQKEKERAKHKKHKKTKQRQTDQEEEIAEQSEQKPEKAKKEQKERKPMIADEKTPVVVSRRHLNEAHQILDKLKDRQYIEPFLSHVDEERDGAPDYYKVIKQPMDLQKIEAKLEEGRYRDLSEFDADVELMWSNSLLFNKKNNCMLRATQMLRKFYRKLMSTTVKDKQK